MRFSLLKGATFAVAAAAAMWSCGGGSSYTAPSNTTPSPTPTPSANTVTVTIVGSSGNKAYNPNPVHVNVGDSLVFKNADSATHHVVMDDNSADMGLIAPGASSPAMTLKGSGGNYHCTIHTSMVGSINGASAPEPPPCTSGYCG